MINTIRFVVLKCIASHYITLRLKKKLSVRNIHFKIDLYVLKEFFNWTLVERAVCTQHQIDLYHFTAF